MIRYLALAIALGGWVCHRDGDNPCAGATTCDTDTGLACCPLGVYNYCGDCHADVGACIDQVYTCKDESQLLDCSFDGLIQVTTCEAGNENGRAVWHIVANGTLSGCGDETVLFYAGSEYISTGVDCGAWTNGLYGGCVPDGDGVTQTNFSVDVVVPASSGSSSLGMGRAHGDAPAIATAPLTCL